MKIIQKSVNEIKPNKYNPNKIPEDKFKSLVENIKKFGFLQPVLIDTKNVIIDGYHRVQACKEAGIKKIQCVIYEGNGDIKEYRKLLTLSMNNLRGENEEDAFEQVIKDLAYSMDYEDIEKHTGFNVNLIANLVQGIKELDYKKEWEGMPEFEQKAIEAYKTITIRCKTKEDYNKLSKILGQNLTEKTKAIWYPKQDFDQLNRDYRYTDES